MSFLLMHEYIHPARSHERCLGGRMRRPSESRVGSFSRPNLADSAAQTYSTKRFVVFFSDSAVGSFGEFPRAIDDPRPACNCIRRILCILRTPDPRSNSCAACSRFPPTDP
jgi:hypothetical protein